MLYPGASIDRYVAEYLLGQGGVAEVWAVRHTVLGTRRALKVLSVDQPGLVERLVEEGRVQARLDHAHVVPVIDVVEVDGLPALVMPLVIGMSLHEAMALVRPTVPEVASVILGVTLGVARAHRLGVAHRDIKPANVLLAVQGERLVPRVADFGLAKALDPGIRGPTRGGVAVGTPVYAAPEQLLNAASADHRADWWAVGVTLYELLAGRRPFHGGSLEELTTAQLERSYPPLDTSALEPGWSALVRDLLEPDPASRLAHGPEVLARLKALVPHGEPVLTDGALLGVVRAAVAARAAARERTPVRSAAATISLAEPASRPRHHLPAERDGFVGREADLAEVGRRLGAGARLLTVLGTGGTGKTRLMVHYGWSTLSRWPGGVWFCDLSEARTVDGIVSAVGRALDVPLGREPVAQLGHAIAGRGECLVILDNFEQVAEHAEETLGPWLDRAEQARFAVTSRQVLGLRGEDVVGLGPLEPDPAVELFTLRAKSAKRGFALPEAERPHVFALVRLLDGLPLAIELAAARVVVMSPQSMLDRMTDRFRLLASGGPRSGRQATLRGAIDWSWDLLSEAERAGLAQLSAFEGGFSLASAEAVLDLSAFPDAPWPVDIVQDLVGKSLVRPVGEDRFALLVSIHEYAAERLADAGAFAGSGAEAKRAAWARHGTHYAEHGADEAFEALFTRRGVERRMALFVELENLLAGCRRAAEGGRSAEATALLRAAWEVLVMRGPLSVGVHLASRVLAMSGLDEADRVRALVVACRISYQTGNLDESLERARAGLELSRRLGDRRSEGRLLYRRGPVYLDQGRLAEARGDLEAALALAREVGDRRTEGWTLNTLGIVAWVAERKEDARGCFQEALEVARAHGDRRSEGIALGNLGEASLYQGHLDEAELHLGAALEITRQVGDRRNEGITLGTIGLLHQRRARLGEAAAALAAGERYLREVGEQLQLGLLLARRGEVEHAAGEPEAAAAALAEAEVIAARLGAPPESELGKLIARLRALLGGDEA